MSLQYGLGDRGSRGPRKDFGHFVLSEDYRERVYIIRSICFALFSVLQEQTKREGGGKPTPPLVHRFPLCSVRCYLSNNAVNETVRQSRIKYAVSSTLITVIVCALAEIALPIWCEPLLRVNKHPQVWEVLSCSLLRVSGLSHFRFSIATGFRSCERSAGPSKIYQTRKPVGDG